MTDGAPARVEGAVHAPRMGRLRRWMGPFYFTGIFWYRFPFFFARWYPEAIKPFCMWLSTWIGYATLPGIRRALAANQAQVLGPCDARETRRRAWRGMHAFGWCLIERAERFLPDRPFAVEFEDLEHWEAASADGRGVLLVTAHVGMWEAASRIPCERAGRVVHLVRERELDPRAQEWFESLLARDPAATFVAHFADDPTLGIRLRAALQEGHLVALQGDRPRRGGRAHEATLFGRPFPIPDGPAALARAAGVPLLPVFALREGRRRYRVRFLAPIDCSRAAATPEEVAHRLAAAFETVIRSAPEQWFRFGVEERSAAPE